MEKSLNFRFQMPQLPKGPVVELTNEQTEKLLLQKLEADKSNQQDALWQLAQFYKLTKQHEKAIARLRELFQLVPDPEEKANCIFTMGQAMEQIGDYPAAVRYYKEASALEPAHTFTWYFINNNLGFCQNTLGQYTEGEMYCRRAIEIDPNRSNAHKNLGIALARQGQHRDAARCFVTATQVNAADPRSFRLLEDLLKQHPELEFEFQSDLDCCRKAIEVIERKIQERKPVVHRGLRKQWVLLRLKLEPFFKRLR